MNYSIKYLATLFFTAMLAIGCDVANTDNDEPELLEKDIIIYTTNKDGSVDIYIANENGSGEVRLTGQ